LFPSTWFIVNVKAVPDEGHNQLILTVSVSICGNQLVWVSSIDLLPPSSTIPEPETMNGPEITSNSVEELDYDLWHNSVNLHPTISLVVNVEAVAGESDDKFILTVIVDIYGGHRPRIDRIELNPRLGSLLIIMPEAIGSAKVYD